MKIAADWFVAPGVVAIEPDVWHHVALVYSGDGSTTYLDGVFDAETPGEGRLDWVGGLLTFGTFQDRFLKGTMDEIKYYDTALTEEEVNADMWRRQLEVNVVGAATTTTARGPPNVVLVEAAAFWRHPVVGSADPGRRPGTCLELLL